MSTPSTKIHRKGIYARTKAVADEVFRSSRPDVTILSPSIFYGESLDGTFGNVYRIVGQLPVMPVLGSGRWHCAPVYVGDVVSAIIASLRTHAVIGREYDIGGPDETPCDELLDQISMAGGGHRRLETHNPMGFALLVARALAILLESPPLTVRNVLGSYQDMAINISAARRELHWTPRPLKHGLPLIFPRQN